jgi:hypothetical protein
MTRRTGGYIVSLRERGVPTSKSALISTRLVLKYKVKHKQDNYRQVLLSFAPVRRNR